MRFAAVSTVTFLMLTALYGEAPAEPGRLRFSVSPRTTVRERRYFILGEGQKRVETGRSFIVQGSDSVFIDGRALVRGLEYRINMLKGSIALVEAASGGERLVVSFSRYPFSFSPVLAKRFPGGKPLPPGVRPSPVAKAKRAARKRDPYRLKLSGSKTVGFSIGSGRDLGIDQSLKVTMVGTIAEDLEVKAFLSDDDLPVQPEGNTEELKYLDRVYVQVKTRHSEVQLGDFSTGLAWSSYSSFQRELRGVMATVEAGGDTFFSGGGIAKGRFESRSFTGVEGVQGPYELLQARRFNSVVILPGTETIYLDGRLLKRGSENDYTIDYNRGTVTFAERVTITDDSEIVTDFQMGEDDYERSTVTAGWTSRRIAGAVRLRAFFFQEADDSDNPLRGGLSSKEMASLKEAGDDPARAMSDGIEQVEPGKGDYLLVPGDTVPSHFVYTESGGEYILDFVEVGQGNGEYRTDGFTRIGRVRYAYAGEGLGDFSIGRPLPLPERNRLFTLGAEAKKGRFFFDGEGNVSIHDRNTLSDLDDGDNAGGAIRLESGVKELPVGPADLSLKGEFSSLESRFKSPDKPRDSYFYRNWNLDDVPLEGMERIGGTAFRLEGKHRWNLGGSYRVLSRDRGLSARKGEVDASVGDLAGRGVHFRALDSKTGDERDRRFARGEGALAFWHAVPRISFETERYRSFEVDAADTGRYYCQGDISLAGKSIGPFRGLVSFSRRLTDMMRESGGQWLRARENDEVRVDGGYSSGHRIVDIYLAHMRNREARTGVTGWYDLGRVRYRDCWAPAGITTDIGYRISSGEERRQEKAVVFVGENQGDYDSEGREVGQKRGDYMVLYLPGGEREAVHTVELTWRMSYGRGLRGVTGSPGGGGWLSRIRRNVSCDHFFSVLEKSRTDDLAGLYMLKPSLLQRNDFTLYGINTFRQEWSFLNNVRKFNLRFTYSREDEEDNRSAEAGLERFNREVLVRLEAAPYSSVTISWEGGGRLDTRRAGGASAQSYRVESVSASQVVNYRITPSMRFSFETGYEKRSDGVSGAEQTSYLATPSFSSSMGAKFNLAAFFKFTYTDAKSDDGKPLFFLEEGLRQDWNLIGQYRFSRNVTFGMNYTGRREKNYIGEVKTIHDFKMECGAYF